MADDCFCGIGVMFNRDVRRRDYYVIQQVIPNGPADAAGGVSVGDLLLEIDGHSAVGITYKELTTRILGKEGSMCTLVLEKSTTRSRMEVQIFRKFGLHPLSNFDTHRKQPASTSYSSTDSLPAVYRTPTSSGRRIVHDPSASWLMLHPQHMPSPSSIPQPFVLDSPRRVSMTSLSYTAIPSTPPSQYSPSIIPLFPGTQSPPPPPPIVPTPEPKPTRDVFLAPPWLEPFLLRVNPDGSVPTDSLLSSFLRLCILFLISLFSIFLLLKLGIDPSLHYWPQSLAAIQTSYWAVFIPMWIGSGIGLVVVILFLATSHYEGPRYAVKGVISRAGPSTTLLYFNPPFALSYILIATKCQEANMSALTALSPALILSAVAAFVSIAYAAYADSGRWRKLSFALFSALLFIFLFFVGARIDGLTTWPWPAVAAPLWAICALIFARAAVDIRLATARASPPNAISLPITSSFGAATHVALVAAAAASVTSALQKGLPRTLLDPTAGMDRAFIPIFLLFFVFLVGFVAEAFAALSRRWTVTSYFALAPIDQPVGPTDDAATEMEEEPSTSLPTTAQVSSAHALRTIGFRFEGRSSATIRYFVRALLAGFGALLVLKIEINPVRDGWPSPWLFDAWKLSWWWIFLPLWLIDILFVFTALNFVAAVATVGSKRAVSSLVTRSGIWSTAFFGSTFLLVTQVFVALRLDLADGRVTLLDAFVPLIVGEALALLASLLFLQLSLIGVAAFVSAAFLCFTVILGLRVDGVISAPYAVVFIPLWAALFLIAAISVTTIVKSLRSPLPGLSSAIFALLDVSAITAVTAMLSARLDGVSSLRVVEIVSPLFALAIVHTIILPISVFVSPPSPHPVSANRSEPGLLPNPPSPAGKYSMTISWQPHRLYSSLVPVVYSVEVRRDRATRWVLLNASRRCRVRVEDLAVGHTYRFRVIAYDATGRMSTAALSEEVHVKSDVPSKVALPAIRQIVTSPASAAVTLAWAVGADNGSPITEYVLELAPDDLPDEAFAERFRGREVEVRLAGLELNKSFRVRVAALNGLCPFFAHSRSVANGRGPYSDELLFRTTEASSAIGEAATHSLVDYLVAEVFESSPPTATERSALDVPIDNEFDQMDPFTPRFVGATTRQYNPPPQRITFSNPTDGMQGQFESLEIRSRTPVSVAQIPSRAGTWAGMERPPPRMESGGGVWGGSLRAGLYGSGGRLANSIVLEETLV